MGGGGGGGGGQRRNDGKDIDWRERSAQREIEWMRSKDPKPKREQGLKERIIRGALNNVITTLVAIVFTAPLVPNPPNPKVISDEDYRRAWNNAKESDEMKNILSALNDDDKKVVLDWSTTAGDRILRDLKRNRPELFKTTPPKTAKEPATPKPRRPRNPSRKPYT